jgi:ferredoxin
MASEEKAKKAVKVDHDVCIGCATCEGIAPDYFKIEDGLAHVVKNYSEEDNDLIEEAINNCPVQAISISDAEEEAAEK